MPWPKLPGLQNIPRPFPRFGDQLRDHRTLVGLSIDEVSHAVGITPTALREIEGGIRTAPSVKIAKELADLLKLTGDQRDLFIDTAEWESGVMGRLLGNRGDARPSRPSLLAAILVFMIADIRGYSRFTQENGDQAAAHLTTRFAEISHSLIEQYGGQLVEVRGDEVLCVFASAQQAVKAASALQQRCAVEAMANADLPMAIGIGLDVGEAVEVEGGYRGAVINRAARLCSLAGAGEVLVSTGVAYLAPQLEGISFVARGQEQLKGFAGPTPILLAAPVESTLATGTEAVDIQMVDTQLADIQMVDTQVADTEAADTRVVDAGDPIE
jgi:class 3 adenylate cyclase